MLASAGEDAGRIKAGTGSPQPVEELQKFSHHGHLRLARLHSSSPLSVVVGTKESVASKQWKDGLPDYFAKQRSPFLGDLFLASKLAAFAFSDIEAGVVEKLPPVIEVRKRSSLADESSHGRPTQPPDAVRNLASIAEPLVEGSDLALKLCLARLVALKTSPELL